MLIKLLINAFLLYAVAYLVPGVTIPSFFTAVIVFLVMSLINVFIKPILKLLILPVNILTLGIFGIVLNIVLFMLITYVVPDFYISSFWSAAFALFLFSILQAVVNTLE